MLNRALILLFLTALLLCLSTQSPSMALAVFKDWIHFSVPLVPLSLAAGVVISCGQIDLSSGAAFSLVGMIIICWSHYFGLGQASTIQGFGVAWISIVLLYCMMCLLIVGCRVPALLCTLGFLFCEKGISLLLQTFASGTTLNDTVLDVSSMAVPLSSYVKVVGWAFLWIPVIIAVLIYWRYFSDAGLHHIAVGIDAKAAEIAGVRSTKIYLTAFLTSGILVGLSSMFFLVDAQGGGWAVHIGWGKELLAIAAAVIGGCRITGGRFDPVCISIATLLVFAVQEAASALPLSSELEYIGLGLGIIVVGCLDFWVGIRPETAFARLKALFQVWPLSRKH